MAPTTWTSWWPLRLSDGPHVSVEVPVVLRGELLLLSFPASPESPASLLPDSGAARERDENTNTSPVQEQARANEAQQRRQLQEEQQKGAYGEDSTFFPPARGATTSDEVVRCLRSVAARAQAEFAALDLCFAEVCWLLSPECDVLGAAPALKALLGGDGDVRDGQDVPAASSTLAESELQSSPQQESSGSNDSNNNSNASAVLRWCIRRTATKNDIFEEPAAKAGDGSSPQCRAVTAALARAKRMDVLSVTAESSPVQALDSNKASGNSAHLAGAAYRCPVATAWRAAAFADSPDPEATAAEGGPCSLCGSGRSGATDVIVVLQPPGSRETRISGAAEILLVSLVQVVFEEARALGGEEAQRAFEKTRANLRAVAQQHIDMTTVYDAKLATSAVASKEAEARRAREYAEANARAVEELRTRVAEARRALEEKAEAEIVAPARARADAAVRIAQERVRAAQEVAEQTLAEARAQLEGREQVWRLQRVHAEADADAEIAHARREAELEVIRVVTEFRRRVAEAEAEEAAARAEGRQWPALEGAPADGPDGATDRVAVVIPGESVRVVAAPTGNLEGIDTKAALESGSGTVLVPGKGELGE